MKNALLLICALFFIAAAPAQPPGTAPETAPATSSRPASQPATHPATQPAVASPFPLSEIVTRIDSMRTRLRAVGTELSGNAVMNPMREQLPTLTQEIAERRDTSSKLLDSNPSVEALRTEQTTWQNLSSPLSDWRRTLASRAAALDKDISSLEKDDATWQQVLTAARAANLPAPILQQVQETIGSIENSRNQAETARSEVLLLQSQIASLSDQIGAELESLRSYRGELLLQMFHSDTPPLWDPAAADQSRAQDAHLWGAQYLELLTYIQREHDRFVIHLVVLVLLMAGMYWARSRFKTWAAAEASLGAASPVFDAPFLNALILAMLLGFWIHPQAPALFRSLSASIAIVPAAMLVRRLAAPIYVSLLMALVALFFLDQLRGLFLPPPLWSRIYFLAELSVALAFLFWFIASRRHLPSNNRDRSRRGKFIIASCRVAVLLIVLAMAATATWYERLGMFLGLGVFRSGYVGIILYACVAVSDGVMIMLLHLRPFYQFAAIRKHMSLIRSRVRRVLAVAAAIYWVYMVLRFFLLSDLVIYRLRWLLTTPLKIGSFSLTLGQVIAAIVTVWASFALSRFIRFLLEEDVYPHVRLPRGLGNALATITHYTVLVIGFTIAVATLGFPMTQLTILTGAFGVGLGFGLQTIINNFFSGIIVLAERPIQVGDIIEMDGIVGTVTRIGIRATIMRTSAGSEIILPNARLINERVINWTLNDRTRSFDIAVNVDSSADPQRVIQLLERIAKDHAEVARQPAPSAELTNFTPVAFSFVLHVWTSRIEEWPRVRSDLALAVHAALAAEKIAIK